MSEVDAELDPDRLAAKDLVDKMWQDFIIHPQGGGYFGALDPRMERMNG